MSYLTVNDLTHAFGEKKLYDCVTFELYKGEHMGIVGQNGAGKSTLINILVGTLVPEQGLVRWSSGLRLGYIDQFAAIEGEQSIEAYLRTAFAPLYEAERALQRVYQAIGSNASPEQLRAIDRLERRLEHGDFYGIDQRIGRISGGLGLDAIGLSRAMNTLSGGQRTKVMLAKLLLGQPDVLLLDEPTNFLDSEHIQWLGGYLQNFEGSFIIVSHDFAFLDRVTNCICEIENQTISKYHGAYADYQRQKQHRRMEYARQYTAQQQTIERLQQYIDKNRARASTARMAQSRQKQLDKIDRMLPPSTLPTPSIAFPALPAVYQRVLKIDKLLVGYDRPLLPPLTMYLEGMTKVAVVGFNGIGKSTLIKTLMGFIPALGGDAAFHPSVRPGYFQQDLIWTNPDLSPLQILAAEYPDQTPKQLRRALARCGVTAQHAMQPIGTLSGGEQNKAKLCRLTLTPCNFLILDEPTNHLDFEAKASLKEAIQAFPGNILLVSHEKEFYQDCVDRVFDMEKMIE